MRKPAEPIKRVRCAIYTRKSTEEGLEQAFNTLDAQREGAEAFVASQKAEGWSCLPARYDDGGFSGGNADRPALKRLLEDIEAGLVDCVVVYKVDRLSRSLLDFARMMETFERHGVSFVSVTQQFNTAHSMGRLTLNILLSFAQFEREIISERTRDKIAAARKKGKWAGGRPVLGYDLISRPGGGRLVVNETEAVTVRSIFALYLELGTLMPVVRACERRGWTTKQWTTKAGRPQGGRGLDKATLHALLTNPVYVGKVRHHEEVYEGEHEAIVDAETFERVRAGLRLNGKTGGSRVRNRHGALLKGLVRCTACGCSMGHHFATSGSGKTKTRYRYYVCANAQRRGWDACPGPSLPAGDLEQLALGHVKELLAGEGVAEAIADRAGAVLAATRPDLAAEPDELLGAAEAFDPVWGALAQGEREDLIRAVVERIEWDAGAETISVVFKGDIDEGDRATCAGETAA